MHEVFNMGCGFCVVVPSADAEGAVELLGKEHRGSSVIGEVTDAPGVVELPVAGLTGRRGEGFKTHG
jgi:phosphoribosylaminoimidazole (AIR) synthetase